MDASGEERKKNILRQRSHVCENKKEVRLRKSILRERERIDFFNFSLHDFFCSKR